MRQFSLRRMGVALAAAALLLYYSPWVQAQDAAARLAVQTAGRAQTRVLIPGGQAVGVALKTQGVLVVARGTDEARTSPLRVGDVILGIEGGEVRSASELGAQVNAAKTDVVSLDVLRGGKRLALEAAVPADASDGRRRLGVWVRDSTAGVGTLSYIDPVTGAYGALGHAIVDGDTGDMVSVRDGAILRADVVGVARGQSGRAGELKGSFLKENEQIGSLTVNSEYGIYGTIADMPEDLLYPQGLPIGGRDSAHPGAATIISTVDGEGPKEYTVEILRCAKQDELQQKSMILRVTDARLLEKTGGIVQGMSGSPIIQDGKLVGAVTHVLVNDPTRGYGIFIENMLDAAG